MWPRRVTEVAPGNPGTFKMSANRSGDGRMLWSRPGNVGAMGNAVVLHPVRTEERTGYPSDGNPGFGALGEGAHP